MTISADGDKTLFKTVQAIVAKAPKLSGWHFYAFRQRMPEETIKGMKVNVEGVELDASKMMFFPMQSGDTLDIIIYVKGITEDNFNDIAYAGLMLLDNVLGEYDCVTKVRSYDFHDMPVKEDELAGLRPLLELPKFVDGFHAGKKKK